MKFKNFLRKSNGNEIEAAKALFAALRSERGIHLRYEALPHLFEIGQTENQRTSLREQPILMRHYAITHDLKQPEEIINHLNINGMTVSCRHYLKSNPLEAHFIDAKRTIRDLQARAIIGKERTVYDLVTDYFTYLSANGINLANSKFEDTLNSKLMHRLTDLGKVADLVLNFGVFISLCPPGWTNLHNSYSRVLVGDKWYDDHGRIAEKKLLDASNKGYRIASHGLCPECNLQFKI